MALAKTGQVTFGFPGRDELCEDRKAELTGKKVREVFGLLGLDDGCTPIGRGSFNLHQFEEGIKEAIDRLIDQAETIRKCKAELAKQAWRWSDGESISAPLFTDLHQAVDAMEEQLGRKRELLNQVTEELMGLVEDQSKKLAENLPVATNKALNEISSYYSKAFINSEEG